MLQLNQPARKKNIANHRCMNCLQFGHYTYTCRTDTQYFLSPPHPPNLVSEQIITKTPQLSTSSQTQPLSGRTRTRDSNGFSQRISHFEDAPRSSNQQSSKNISLSFAQIDQPASIHSLQKLNSFAQSNNSVQKVSEKLTNNDVEQQSSSRRSRLSSKHASSRETESQSSQINCSLFQYLNNRTSIPTSQMQEHSNSHEHSLATAEARPYSREEHYSEAQSSGGHNSSSSSHQLKSKKPSNFSDGCNNSIDKTIVEKKISEEFKNAQTQASTNQVAAQDSSSKHDKFKQQNTSTILSIEKDKSSININGKVNCKEEELSSQTKTKKYKLKSQQQFDSSINSSESNEPKNNQPQPQPTVNPHHIDEYHVKQCTLSQNNADTQIKEEVNQEMNMILFTSASVSENLSPEKSVQITTIGQQEIDDDEQFADIKRLQTDAPLHTVPQEFPIQIEEQEQQNKVDDEEDLLGELSDGYMND